MSRQTTVDNLWTQNIRPDGRSPTEMRQIKCSMGVFDKDKGGGGSAYFQIGNTKAVATVYGPHEGRASQKKVGAANQDKMTVNFEYSSACFSTNDRKTSTKADRKSMEMSCRLKSIMDNVFVHHLSEGSQVDIYIELIQDDGGAYAACINAVTLACIDAGVPLQDFVVACSATMAHGIPMIDISAAEKSTGMPELTLGILSKSKEIVVMEQNNLLKLIYFSDVLNLALDGCQRMLQVLEETCYHKFSLLQRVIEANLRRERT